MQKPRLYIFAKQPLLGRAKTRLAAGIGTVHALRLYRAMTQTVLRNVQDPRWETVLAVTPPSSLGRVRQWRDVPQISQVGGSLSPRLAEIFKDRGPILVIGTDCPQVSAHDIANGFRALKTHQAVFGPADDGGFWLIGMNGPVGADIFDNVRWSHAQTLADMEARISGPIKRLRTLIDVDDVAALRAVRAQSWPRG